jgi:hypothetical protein
MSDSSAARIDIDISKVWTVTTQAHRRYPRPPGVGRVIREMIQPKNLAAPKVKIPPSEATSQ